MSSEMSGNNPHDAAQDASATKNKAAKLPRFLTHEEIAGLFHAASDSHDARDSMLLKSLYYLGLRNSELRSLKNEDIDVANRKVRVSLDGKERLVPIPGEFADEMASFIAVKGILFEGRNSEGLLSDRHLRRIVKGYAVKAGIRNPGEVHPHTLRHSYATHLQNSGVPISVIQGILGHARAETTAMYSRMGTDRAREFIERAFKVRYGGAECSA